MTTAGPTGLVLESAMPNTSFPGFVSKYGAPLAVARHYGLRPRRISSVRKVYKIDTDDGSWALKRSRLAAKDILFVHQVKEHVASCGFPNVDRFLLAPSGLPYVEHGGDTYVMTRWEESRESDYDIPEDLERAAKVLARFHICARGLHPDPSFDHRVFLGKWPAKFMRRILEMKAFKETAKSLRRQTKFDERYLEHLDYFLDEAREAVALLLRSRYGELVQEGTSDLQVCHHDYSNRNVLVKPDGSAHLVDFDYTIVDIKVHDVASLILRNMRRAAWDFTRAKTVINSYSRVLELSQPEIDLIYVFLRWPQDFWQVGLQYYVEHQPWPMKRFTGILRKRTSHLEEREAFLERFRREYVSGL